MNSSNDTSAGREHRSMIAHHIDEYHLQKFAPKLERLWTADEERYGHRRLAN